MTSRGALDDGPLAGELRGARELLGVALPLGAREVTGWTAAERALVRDARPPRHAVVEQVRRAIADGGDPLGDAFGALHTPEQRRPSGATYTPPAMVAAMLRAAAELGTPELVVDPGAGSGRFAVAAGRRFPDARLLAVELDPFAAILARAHLAAAGLADRSRVAVADYRTLDLDPSRGRTLFLGNPPYVRHHLIDARWKSWLVEASRRFGLRASRLAGLHVHFFVATALYARAGDFGLFVTAAEWLDVNYGSLVRQLLLDVLGLSALDLLEPTARPFTDAHTTAAISHFAIGARPATVRLRRLPSLDALLAPGGSRAVTREALAAAPRWTPLTRAKRSTPRGFVELGELCRVHRGQVTGGNRVWIAGEQTPPLPARTLVATVTRARELFDAGGVLSDDRHLRRVVELPQALDALTSEERRQVEAFLAWARQRGGADGFVAKHRGAWFRVGLYAPAPILATYMARRPPTFVRNVVGARHLNIAHGLYPREPMTEPVLFALVRHLREKVSLRDGRTYAGGLTKFEPKEMERILVPGPELLEASGARIFD